jgi:hypothetical protein
VSSVLDCIDLSGTRGRSFLHLAPQSRK